MKKKDVKIENKFNWKKAISFLLVLWITGILLDVIFFDVKTGNVAVIDVKGVIASNYDSFMSSGNADPDVINGLINEAVKNPNTKAIVFEVNSGGGSPVASDEISQKIESLKGLNITTIAYIRDIGASGAYWIAASTDHIMANRMSLVGSIGVTGAYLSFEGLLDRYNITYNRMIAGDYKDLGSPYKEMTDEEKEMLEMLLFDLRDEFIYQVSSGRNMNIEKVESFATGEVWLGKEALRLGFVDSLGSEAELISFLETKLNETVQFEEYHREVSFSEMIYGFTNGFGKSIGEGLTSDITNSKLYIR
ncbi:signal peptide peptidase SppA [Candidatus Woesearchaeota archaeon]|nr:MAG: signal peptide peptidase SppA [Candidatus Woesearchaeota archaeon]